MASTIELNPDVVMASATKGLEEFSHIEVVYFFDRIAPDAVQRGSRHPRGNPDWPDVGILAQRAKNRPNRIGVSRARLVEVDGLLLNIRDLDAIDGTPVLDIKPYMNEFGPRGPVHQPAWSGELMSGYWGAPTGTGADYGPVAEAYAQQFSNELDAKPTDRALLNLLIELATEVEGAVADLGCGPGQAGVFIQAEDIHGRSLIGIDLSPAMCAEARANGLAATAGSLDALPVASGTLAALSCFYSVIHLDWAARAAAYEEMHRSLAAGGWALVSFHVSDDLHGPGSAVTRSEWFGRAVDDIVFRFLDPNDEAAAMRAAGLEPMVRVDRHPDGDEYPSQRCYLLARRPVRP